LRIQYAGAIYHKENMRADTGARAFHHVCPMNNYATVSTLAVAVKQPVTHLNPQPSTISQLSQMG
jgi:hypothetical protein